MHRKQDLFSIRMHATSGGRHVSGAERIVPFDAVQATICDLVARATGRTAHCDQIVLTADSLKDAIIRSVTALNIVTVSVTDPATGRFIAGEILRRSGISSKALSAAIGLLSRGPSPFGQIMRGAIIMDSQTGERLEHDPERGVRASRFDWSPEIEAGVKDLLAAAGLLHFRTREALALATKVAHAPGVIAELCWSDDPDYTAGYVASLAAGYVRFPFLKTAGDEKGGRVFFVRRDELDLRSLLTYLENEPVLITNTGTIGAMSPDEYLNRINQGEGARNRDA